MGFGVYFPKAEAQAQTPGALQSWAIRTTMASTAKQQWSTSRQPGKSVFFQVLKVLGLAQHIFLFSTQV